MIRFLCPRCKKTLTVPESAAGQKTHCGLCGQRLQVPVPPPPQNKTVLGSLVSVDAPPPQPPPPHPEPIQPTVAPEAEPPPKGPRPRPAPQRDDYEDDYDNRPHRSPRSAPAGRDVAAVRNLGELLITFGILILILGGVVTGYYLLEFDTTVPSDPELEHFGHHSRQVHNLGLMHQQTVWTIAGITAGVVGIAMIVTGKILYVTARRVDHRDLGSVHPQDCEICQCEQPFRLVLSYRYERVWQVFVNLRGRSYLLVCDVCKTAYRVPRGTALRLAKLDREPRE